MTTVVLHPRPPTMWRPDASIIVSFCAGGLFLHGNTSLISASLKMWRPFFMMWSFSLWPQNYLWVSVSEKNSRQSFFIWLHSNIGIFASVQIIWLWIERWMTWYLKTCILFVYRMGPKCSVYVNVQSVLFVLTFSDKWDVNDILAKAVTEKDTQDIRL